MTLKTIIDSKESLICDICNNEIIKLENMPGEKIIGLRVCNQFWKINKFQEFDICKKHRKEVIAFINNLKEKVKQ